MTAMLTKICFQLAVFTSLFSLITAYNRIVIENEKSGTPNNEWDINGAGDKSIQGFAVPFSINIGEYVEFRINTTAIKWRIDIYRIGYYEGNGARKIATFIKTESSIQPNCIQLPKWRTISCNNWSPTHIFSTANRSLISGVYFARLTRLDVTTSDHPHYNWRIDNSYISASSQFCEENCENKPKPSIHSYGASGYGIPRHKLKEPYASHIYFIIRNDESKSDIIMQTSDTTWNAYNRYGGSSSYGTFNPLDERERALKLTYNRPIVTRDYRSINMLFSCEYPAIRFLEKNGFDITYISGLDMSILDDDEIMLNRLMKHKVFLSVGHDEYWSWRQRELIKNGINNGLNVFFWSGNEMYWKIRFEHDINKNVSGNPRMVIFKETRKRTEKIDKESNIWTGTWRDEHDAFIMNENGPYPENAITGQLYTVDVWRSDPIHIPWYFAAHKFWRNCDEINRLNIGDDAYILRKPLIGHEFDEDIDNGYRPEGLQHLSLTIIDNVQYLLDWGTMYDTGTAQHHLTIYKHSKSNALIFGAGSIMFSWGLDDYHDSKTGIPPHLENYYDCRALKDGYGTIKELQQAMFNLFADCNVNKPQTMDDKKFIYKKYNHSNIGKPISWIYYFDGNENVKNEMKKKQDIVPIDNENGLKCIRIEGGSKIINGNKGIIGGIEIVVTNQYIHGINWNQNQEKRRWYAAIIDYEKIQLNYKNIKDINEWYWYFEAWIDINMKQKLYVLSKASNDNGDIQDIKDMLFTDINLDKLKPCIAKQWIWRKRPILSPKTSETVSPKTEL